MPFSGQFHGGVSLPFLIYCLMEINEIVAHYSTASR